MILHCVLFTTCFVATKAQQVIPVPNENWRLSDYLCGSQSSQVVNLTILELDTSSEHVMPSDQFCVHMNVEGLTLQSSGSGTAIIRCEGNGLSQSGIGFVGARQLTIRNIKFENCGGVMLNNSMGYPSTTIAPVGTSPENAIRMQQQAVLLLSFCTHVTIVNMTFSRYRGYAIYALNVFGNIKFQRTVITSSYAYLQGITSSNRNDLLESGSGIYLHFLDMFSPPPLSQSNIYITDVSNISNNWNVYPMFLLERLRAIRLQNEPQDFPLSGGAAVTVHFEQTSYRVRLMVEDSETRNNAASTAGSMKVISRNTINNADISIKRCVFFNNTIFQYSDYFTGAGLQMYFEFSYNQLGSVTSTASEKAVINVVDSLFERNSAKTGAAIAVFAEAQNVSEIEVNVKTAQFIENEASVDGDCLAAQSEQSAYYRAKDLVLTFESIQVNHTGDVANIDVDRSAALSFSNVIAKLNGTREVPSLISNGNNSAIKAYNTKLFLSQSVQFVKNTALHGGAIALEANSFLFFVEPSSVLFAQNVASRGGAVYSDFTSGDRCVLQFTALSQNYTNSVAFNVSSLRKLDYEISFVDNLAEDGNATYAQPIFNCSWYSESIVQFPSNEVEKVYDTLFTFKVDNRQVSYRNQMRSHPRKPCYCQKDGNSSSFNEFVCLSENVVDSVETFPGKSFEVNLIPVDDLGQPLRSVVEARVVNDGVKNVRFSDNLRRDVKDLNGTSCYPARYTLHGAQNTTITLNFGSLESVGQFIQLDVDLQQCPFGFEYKNQSGICDCIPLYKNNNFACDIENGLFTKTDFEDGIYWIGETVRDYGDVFLPGYSKRCPEGYCERNKTLYLDLLNKTLCVGNRTKEMCGQCKPGMSMKFGTTDCGRCSNYWLFTIVLYAGAGIFIVFMLFLLKMTITDGTLISIIFYAQLFSINLNLLAGTNETRFATVFISLLNLELGFPICFYSGMDFAGKIGFQFVFPIYLWVLVGLITYLCRYSGRLSSLIGAECVKVFVTLFYLSYTKLVRTVFEVFVWGVIETERDTQIVWFFDGTVRFFIDWRHFLLVFVSLLVFLIVITPYKFFLLFSQWCLRNPWISRHFKPLIDANLAPFKDRWRFWLGLRLLITEILILISIIFTAINPKIVAFSHVATIMTFMMFQAYTRPYKSKFINILDLFFIINFLLFVTTCVFLYVVVFRPGMTITTSNPYLFAVEVIYVGSAFIVCIGVVVYHAVRRVKNYRKAKIYKVNQPTVSEVSIGGPESISLGTSQDVRYTTIDAHIHIDDFARLRESLLED